MKGVIVQVEGTLYELITLLARYRCSVFIIEQLISNMTQYIEQAAMSYWAIDLTNYIQQQQTKPLIPVLGWNFDNMDHRVRLKLETNVLTLRINASTKILEIRAVTGHRIYSSYSGTTSTDLRRIPTLKRGRLSHVHIGNKSRAQWTERLHISTQDYYKQKG